MTVKKLIAFIYFVLFHDKSVILSLIKIAAKFSKLSNNEQPAWQANFVFCKRKTKQVTVVPETHTPTIYLKKRKDLAFIGRYS